MHGMRLAGLVATLCLCLLFLFSMEARDALHHLPAEHQAERLNKSTQVSTPESLTPDRIEAKRFWWNWWVQAATAVATFLAVLAALFLDWFRARFFPPVLVLTMVEQGAPPPVKTHVGQFETVSRWYHVQVKNARRMSPARDTHLYLVAVEMPDGGGGYVIRTTGTIPLQVRHEGVQPGRVLGPVVEWDLLSVTRELQHGGQPVLDLHPGVIPSDITVRYTQAARMVLRVQAQSIETDSNVLRVEIVWDGRWSDDANRMATTHLVITPSDSLP
jgi:hypothetical protein